MLLRFKASDFKATAPCERICAIFTRLINACWFLFKYGLLLSGLAAIALLWYFQDTLNDKIHSHVEQVIATAYPHLDVQVGTVQRVEGKGILIRDLTLIERDASGPQAELAHFEEILLGCRAQIQDLVRGKPNITHVILRHPTFRATRRADGTWSIERLLPLPNFGGTARALKVEQGSLVLFDPLKNPSGMLSFRDINLVFQLSQSADNQTADRPLTEVKGSLTGEHLGRAEIEGWINNSTGHWKLAGRLDDIDLSPELQQALPGEFAQRLSTIHPLRGRLEMNFQADHDPRRTDPWQFDARGRLTEGRIDDDRLPYLLTDVKGDVHINQHGITIHEITARNGRTSFWLSGEQKGFGPSPIIKLRGKVERLILDNHIVAKLPVSWRETWNRYLPGGEINATFQLDHDGQRWHPEAMVDCVSVAFTHYKFPYRLEQGHGKISLKNNQLALQLQALAGNRPVDITANITNPGRNGIGEVLIRADKLPLNEQLLQAIPQPQQTIIRSFAPRGTVNSMLHITRSDPKARWIPHHIIDLNAISIRYEKFPYPLHDVRGRLEGIGKEWTYRDLSGNNDTGVVTAVGRLMPTASGSQLTLQFTGTNVSLDEELQNALPANMRRFWKQLKPQGSIDVSVALNFTSEDKVLNLAVGAELDGIRVEPTFFPYRMENLRGRVVYQNGRADFANLTASHGNLLATASGNCEFPADGSWKCDFTSLNVDRIRTDRDLLLALPASLRKGLTTLNFTGPFNLSGAMRFARASGTTSPVTADWNIGIDTLQGKIDCGIQLDQISGGIDLTGSYDGQRFYSRGELDIDSLLYQKVQFTQIHGPLWFNDQHVLFGGWAERQTPGKVPRRVTANFYGGQLISDCQISLGDTARFSLNSQLSGANLATLATEMVPGGRNLSGDLSGNFQLRGSSRGAHTLQGAGTMQLRDGNVYELPLVLSLLKILSIREPDSTAFNKCDVDFKISGTHILFDQFNFHGDAISLLGKGEMDFDHNLRMVFHAIIGNDQLQLPIVRPLLGLASQQLLLLYVYGTLEDPKTTREALPGVRRAVEEIQQEAEKERTMIGKTTDWFQDWIR